MVRILITLIMLCLSSGIIAQDFKQDMIKVREAYAKLKNYQCNYDIEVYFDGKLNSAIKMDFKWSDSSYQYTIGREITSVCNSSWMLTVDNDLKMIAYCKRKPFSMDIEDKLPDEKDSLTYEIYPKKEANGLHSYTIVYKSGPILQSTIVVDPETGYVSYMDYINREAEEYDWRIYGVRKTVIKISQLKSMDALSDNYFSIDKYVIKTADGFKPTEAYKNYQLLDAGIKIK